MPDGHQHGYASTRLRCAASGSAVDAALPTVVRRPRSGVADAPLAATLSSHAHGPSGLPAGACHCSLSSP